MTKILLLGVAGFIGALARYFLQGIIQANAGSVFPFGTLVVNVSGCFILGLLRTIYRSLSHRSAVAHLLHRWILRRLYYFFHFGLRDRSTRERPGAMAG